MDKVGSDELCEERGDDIGEEDDAFWQRADEVLGGGEDDYVEHIVDQAYRQTSCNLLAQTWKTIGLECAPSNQKATTTLVLGCFTRFVNREP